MLLNCTEKSRSTHIMCLSPQGNNEELRRKEMLMCIKEEWDICHKQSRMNSLPIFYLCNLIYEFKKHRGSYLYLKERVHSIVFDRNV